MTEALRAQQHPDHDELAAEVASWYRSPFPDMGFTAECRWFGVLRGNTDFEFNAVTATSVGPEEIAAMDAEIGEHYGPRTVHLSVVDGSFSKALHTALLDAGWRHEVTQTYLAHVGDLPQVDPPDGFRLEQVGDDGLEVFSRVKLMGFASSEAEPTRAQIDHELSVRRAEAGGGTAFLLASVGDDPAGIVAFYGGDDSMIFLVATRVPFRGTGVASASIRSALEERYASGCRSVVINGDAADHPVEIYRGLGFVDEVYREHRYEKAF